jgi:hypothetical protein
MALRCLDVELHDVPRPEIYAAPVSRAFLDKASCHLIFKPTEWIRLLKGVRNIAWVIWEFDELTGRETSGPQHPFADMRRMLTIPHEIWTPCEFTRQVFRAAGIPNVPLHSGADCSLAHGGAIPVSRNPAGSGRGPLDQSAHRLWPLRRHQPFLSEPPPSAQRNYPRILRRQSAIGVCLDIKPP